MQKLYIILSVFLPLPIILSSLKVDLVFNMNLESIMTQGTFPCIGPITLKNGILYQILPKTKNIFNKNNTIT